MAADVRRSLQSGDAKRAYEMTQTIEVVLAAIEDVGTGALNSTVPIAESYGLVIDNEAPQGPNWAVFKPVIDKNKTAKLVKAGKGTSKGGKRSSETKHGPPELRAKRDSEIIAEFSRHRRVCGKTEAYGRTASKLGVSERTVWSVVKGSQ